LLIIMMMIITNRISAQSLAGCWQPFQLQHGAGESIRGCGRGGT